MGVAAENQEKLAVRRLSLPLGSRRKVITTRERTAVVVTHAGFK